MIPFLGALDFFLGFWLALPYAIQTFVSMCIILVVATALVRAVLDL